MEDKDVIDVVQQEIVNHNLLVKALIQVICLMSRDIAIFIRTDMRISLTFCFHC
jgi:hypothetical protein